MTGIGVHDARKPRSQWPESALKVFSFETRAEREQRLTRERWQAYGEWRRKQLAEKAPAQPPAAASPALVACPPSFDTLLHHQPPHPLWRLAKAMLKSVEWVLIALREVPLGRLRRPVDNFQSGVPGPAPGSASCRRIALWSVVCQVPARAGEDSVQAPPSSGRG